MRGSAVFKIPPRLFSDTQVKLPVYRAVPTDNADMVTRSAFVTAHSAKAGRAETDSRIGVKADPIITSTLPGSPSRVGGASNFRTTARLKSLYL